MMSQFKDTHSYFHTHESFILQMEACTSISLTYFFFSFHPCPLWQPPVCSLYYDSVSALLCLFICFAF